MTPVPGASSFSAGEIVAGRYRVLKLIGRGGMGEVYEAEDQLLGEYVALKTVRADRASTHSLARLQKEIQLARKVTHPNVGRVFEVGLHQSLLFYAMELLEGETLQARIRRAGPQSREEAFPIAIQMAEALAAAHAIGIVHTDFKSANVILVRTATEESRAVVTDFGLARLEPPTSESAETRTLTSEQLVVGTLGYMSPEQLAGGPLTAASDIYSFGIVLFEMATGWLPFEDRHVIQSAMQRVGAIDSLLRRLAPGIGPHWEAAILRCLRTEPGERFRSARELADYLGRSAWRAPFRYWTRREWSRLSVAAAVPSMAITGMWIWTRRPYKPAPVAAVWYQKGINALHSMSYETARRAFSQAVALDPKFALAHGGLARACDELDYTDLAKDSMLRAMALAQEVRTSSVDSTRLRALRFMISREYDRAAPLLGEIEAQAEPKERPAAALESGWLAQLREDTNAAAAAYQRALKMDPSYAAAHLRLGYLFGRRGNDAQALESFAEAERLYNFDSDLEGVTESMIQTAILLNRRSRALEAKPVIQRALEIARAVGNRYQEIELLRWKGVSARILGEPERAADLTQQAIDAAIAARMDNLGTSLLLDLGNTLLISGDYRGAEGKYQRALDLARRGKVRRLEFRALTNMGSACEQDHRPAEARQFLEAALPFYRQAGYRRELIQTAALLGGVLDQLGEYDQGIGILREVLPSAVDLKDRLVEAGVRERLGESLRTRGDWPEALAELEKATNLQSGVPAALTRVSCAQMYWLLGRTEEADQALSAVERSRERAASPALVLRLLLVRAEIAFAAGRLGEVEAFLRQIRAANPEADSDLALLDARMAVRAGKVAEGESRMAAVIDRLNRAKMAGAVGSARLAIAAAWLDAGSVDLALQEARDALQFFEPRQIWESVVRGHLILAGVLRNPAEVNEHLSAGRGALDQLRKTWPPASVESYRRRVDLQRLGIGRL